MDMELLKSLTNIVSTQNVRNVVFTVTSLKQIDHCKECTFLFDTDNTDEYMNVRKVHFLAWPLKKKQTI